MPCPNIPRDKAGKVVGRTDDTGNEHAFVVCGDGSTSQIIEGESDRLDISEGIEACEAVESDDGMIIFHTHPNGVKRLSKPDKQVLGRDDVDTVCVADPDGDFMCRSQSQCTGSVE